MELVVHGTNGWYETENGTTSCTGIYNNDFTILFDIGSGFKNVSRLKTIGKPLYIFLSHIHLDHILGIHLLCLHKPSFLKVFIPSDLYKSFRNIFKAPFIKDLNEMEFPIEIQGINANKYTEPGFMFECAELHHNTVVFGYKLIIENKVISYCVDTKSCPNVKKMSENSDIFICDSALKINENSEGKYHMNMIDAAYIAKESGVKKMVLTHFGPTRYNKIEHRYIEAKRIEKIFKDYIIGEDNLLIEL